MDPSVDQSVPGECTDAKNRPSGSQSAPADCKNGLTFQSNFGSVLQLKNGELLSYSWVPCASNSLIHYVAAEYITSSDRN